MVAGSSYFLTVMENGVRFIFRNRKRGQFHFPCSTALLLSVFLPLWFVHYPAGATQPSVTEMYVDIEGFAAIARNHFPEDVVAEAKDQLLKNSNEFFDRSSTLNHPYGPAFVAFDMFMFRGLDRALRVLWRASCKIGDCSPMVDFLASIQQRTRVRAMMRSPGYSGCAEAQFELVDGIGGGQTITLRFSARQFNGCERVKRGRYVENYGLSME